MAHRCPWHVGLIDNTVSLPLQSQRKPDSRSVKTAARCAIIRPSMHSD